MNDLALTVNDKDIQDAITSAVKVFNQLDNSIEKISEFIDVELKNYTVEKIGGKIAQAKKARATLNQGAKDLNNQRLALEKKWNAHFSERKEKINELKKKIENASFEIDAIIKAEETKEKEAKLTQCKILWNVRQFKTVSFEQIFNEKWLNATFKIKDIQAEMDYNIEKIKSDLKLLERLYEAEELKAFYLIDLSLEKAMQKSDELRQARERAEKEKAERPEREHAEAIHKQQVEIIEDEKKTEKEDSVSSLAMEVLGIEEETEITFTLQFTVTREKANRIKQIFTDENVLYKQVKNQ